MKWIKGFLGKKNEGDVYDGDWTQARKIFGERRILESSFLQMLSYFWNFDNVQ